MAQIFEHDLATYRSMYQWADVKAFAVNNAGDTCQKTGFYFEVIIVERRMIDKIYVESGQTFPALRGTGNRWVYDFLTEIQYKVPNL